MDDSTLGQVNTLVNQANTAVQGATGGKIDVKHNKQLMDYQNQLNNANWIKQNERQDYLLSNSADITKKSYQNAGLSPALLTAGNYSPNVASSMPKLDSVGLSSNFSNSAQSRQTDIQARLAENTMANQTKVADAQVRAMNADSSLKETDLGTRSDINNATLQNLLTQNVLDKSQIDKVASETDVNRQNYMYLLNTFDERVKAVTLQNDVTAQEFKKLQEDTRFVTNQNLWMPRLWQSQINLQVAQGNLARAEARRAQAQIAEIEYTYNELLPAQKRLADMQNDKIYNELPKIQSEAELANLQKEVYGSVDPKVRSYTELVLDVVGGLGSLVTAGGIGFGGVTQGIKNLKTSRNHNRPYQE